MTDFRSIDWIISALQAWPHHEPPPVPPATWRVDLHRRLADAIDDAARRSARVGTADLAGLVGHVLRREAAIEPEVPLSLTAPASRPWPTSDGWGEVGVRAIRIDDRFRLDVTAPWAPHWLPDPSGLGDVFAERRRRTPHAIRADPMFAEALGHDEYRSEGQRQAVRTVFAVPPRGTVVAALPTGTGKSAVAYAPALQWSRHAGVTVVVVPTIALALDQERALKGMFGQLGRPLPPCFAYYGSLDEDARSEIKRGIRDGSQGIVFAGPESVTGSLAPALYDAAEAGLLRLFVIDEAHLVSAWGAQFRPEFQALAGVRNELLAKAEAAEAPFPTLLMTATLTEEALQTLHDLFSSPGPFICVPSLVLRPEPGHWFVACEDELQRTERLLEAIRHVPRPLIVYTTRVDHADELAATLRASGYVRVTSVTGKTPSSRRLKAIHSFSGAEWTGSAGRTEVDIVVATSAFGLGVDNAHVRTVLHACIPETVDRYYQEVGRAGRDGSASMALLLHAPEDVAIATSLSSTKVITPPLALERWNAMMASASPGENGRLRVSLRALRTRLYEDNEANQAWNQRTLALLARAGLIDLVAETPPTLPPGDPDSPEWEQARQTQLDEYFTSRVVVPRDDVVSALRSTSIEEVRKRTRRADRRGIDLMLAALRAERDLAEILVTAYTVPEGPGEPPAWPSFAPDRSCGGCPACRRQGKEPYEGVSPLPPPPRSTAWRLGPSLDRMLGADEPRVLTVTYERSDRRLRRDLAEAVAKSAVQGLTSVVGPPWLAEQRAVREAHVRAARSFLFFHESMPTWFALPALPTLIVHDPKAPMTVAPSEYFAGVRAIPARVMILPSDLRDPDRPHQTVAELRHPIRTLDQYLGEL